MNNTTGYLTSFAATYQLEGVTKSQALRAAEKVQHAIQLALEEVLAEVSDTNAKSRVLCVRVERRGELVEEY